MTHLYIKNMVCDRCVMVVRQILTQHGLTPSEVTLGEAVIAENLDEDHRDHLRQALEAVGFELLEDEQKQLVNRIGTLVIRWIRYDSNALDTNLSRYLVDHLHQDYSALSKTFSEMMGKTIERYAIEQRIERVKELLQDNQLSLKEIAVKLHYSSTAHLSAQFKQVTGLTASAYRKAKPTRQGIDYV